MSAVLEAPKMDVHQAVKTALKFFEDSFKAVAPRDVQLEEIEMSDDGKHWLITVGYQNPSAAMRFPAPIRELVNPSRKYKVVRIDAKRGEPLSIKIRKGL